MSGQHPSHLTRLKSRLMAGALAVIALTITSGSPAFPTVGSAVTAKEPEHMFTNQLIGETSPYLLQHAHNPVNWYPWGAEAFAKAKREDKPIFLSVGYSTCYWCHVMEVESFEDPEVAAVINKHFIAIKVDREERPDIDEQYMLTTQMMTGRGGWPNSVWLKPDGTPWMAGTYFPKKRFIGVLTQINDLWVNHRDDVDRQADMLVNAAKQVSAQASVESVPLSPQLVTEATAKLLQQYDPTNGGFGRAPKFPPHGTLALLIDQYRVTGNKKLLAPIRKTLDAMWLGGMHDHLGGGFHRYATDSNWLLPHFEKMLYDNAQLINLYADGFQITGEDRYRIAVADIYRWVKREMTSPEGAFYSALDSGEVGKEGEAYIWSMDQLTKQLGEKDAALYGEVYNFRREGNFQEESTGEKTGKNIPHSTKPIEVIAKDQQIGEQEFIERLSEIEDKLLAHRLTWPQPHKDDKVLTSWNGLMIEALAHAGRVLGEPIYVNAAADAANFILESMVQDGKLLRTYRNGNAKLPGYLDDHVFFAKGLVELHLATGDPRWLDQAVRLADVVIEEFQDDQEGGFFFTGDNHEELIVRSKQLGGGGNMPNTNGVAAQLLLALDELTQQSRYRDSAAKTLRSLSGAMSTQPHTSEHLLVAVSKYLSEAPTDKAPTDRAPTDRAPTDRAPTDRAPTDRARETTEAEKFTRRVDPITIRASVSKDTVKPGDQLIVSVVVEIDDGWHLYAKNPEAEFLIPTTVSVASKTAITSGDVLSPESQSRMDPVLKKTINTYRGNVTFKVPVQIDATAKPGQTDLKVTVNSQACDDSRCLQPQTTTLNVNVVITDAK